MHQIALILFKAQLPHYLSIMMLMMFCCFGGTIDNHFPDVGKVIEAGKGAIHEIDDILLTRYKRH